MNNRSKEGDEKNRETLNDQFIKELLAIELQINQDQLLSNADKELLRLQKDKLIEEEVKNLYESRAYDEDLDDSADEKFDLITKQSVKNIIIGGETSMLPIVGKVSPKSIFEYIGPSQVIDPDNVVVNLDGESIENSFLSVFDAEDILLISYPVDSDNSFEVTLSGQVANPGIYQITSNTTLDDLYKMAGGFRDNASLKGIVVTRESVKQKEKEAVKSANKVLIDALIGQIGNPLNSSGSISATDISAILKLSENIQYVGRVNGDFQPGSEQASRLYLEEGDTVFVPYSLNTISIAGEVLNPITTTFKNNLSFSDYINFAGGYSDYASKRDIYVIKANGEALLLDNKMFRKQAYPEPGDTLVIPRNLDKLNTIPLVSVSTKIISDIAFAAASINSLNN